MRILIVLFFISSFCYGQIQSIDSYTGLGAGGVTRFNNYPALGKKITEKVEYSEIKGNCFWDSDWNAALLVLKNGTNVKLRNVKLNLYTNDIHYLNNTGAELVALTGATKIIFFDKKDTAKVSAMFQWFSFAGKTKASFDQVLAGHEIQLLKNYIVSLSKEVDPVTSKSDYRFGTVTDYFILEKGNVSPLKSINKNAILSIVKATKEREEWLQANRNKLKNEADAIAFINFCNSSQLR
jgi:hypothetical protein